MREFVWIGTSLDDVRGFPVSVRQVIGYALFLAQNGGKHRDAKPLQGFSGAGVLEVTARDAGSTFRAVYTLTLPNAVYVLHAFQKKSTREISTPSREIELVRWRFQRAREFALQRQNRDEEWSEWMTSSPPPSVVETSLLI